MPKDRTDDSRPMCISWPECQFCLKAHSNVLNWSKQVDFATSNVLSQKLKEFYWTVTRAVGLGYLHDGSGYKPRKRLLPLLCYPLYVLPARVLSQAGVRFIDAPVNVIEQVGHLAMDFDAYFKDQLLAHRKVIPVLLCAGRKPANEALLAHWPRNIRVIRSGWVCWLLRPLMSFPEVVDSLRGYCSILRGASRTYDVQSRWADRAPIFHRSEAEIARGEAELRALGIPEGAWFVCVHSREGGYAPADEWANSYRNTNIADYMEAMRAIVARGGWCIRLGDPTMRPLDPMPGVVDYARSSSKSDWMDLFLCARCRFFLGNSSGLFGLAGIFGKPSALANMTPLGGVYSLFPSDISIPKLLMDAQGRMLPLPDAFADEASELRLTPEFAERGLRQVDNTPQEIAELAIEMLDRLDGKLKDEPDDADLQARFRALIQPHHYCWHASARIGRAFLRRHRDLLMSARNLELDLREHEDLLSYKEAAGGKVRNKIPIDMSRFGSLQPRSNKFGDAMLIHIIIAVWSEKYIGLMRDYALPTLLYTNNLGSVTRKHKCVLVLYCKEEEEEEEINKIPALELIRKLCEVEIVHIDPENAPNAYIAMARAHHHPAVRAKQRAAKVIFYCPDGVMANGSLERAVFLAEQGKRAVMVPRSADLRRRGFGFVSVSSESREPSPPAKITAFVIDGSRGR